MSESECSHFPFSTTRAGPVDLAVGTFAIEEHKRHKENRVLDEVSEALRIYFHFQSCEPKL